MFAFHLASSSLKSYKFFKVSSGRNPVAPLFLAANGVLYGSTPIDGPKGGGTIFSFNPDKVGFKNLHAFSGPDGSGPFAGLIADSSGLLYGTTVSGGNRSRRIGHGIHVRSSNGKLDDLVSFFWAPVMRMAARRKRP